MTKRITLSLLLMVFIFGGISQAAVTTYATRTAFDLAHPGLVIENFEAAADELDEITEPFLHKYVMGNDQILDETTDNDVFSPGDIISGIQIYSDHGESHNLAVLGVGCDHYGMPIDSVKISNTNDASSLNLAFPEGVNAVAFDFLYGGPNVGVKVFNIDDVLIPGYEFELYSNFFGIYSSEHIYRIEIDCPYGPNNGWFEAIDNVAFGKIILTPETKIANLIEYYEDAVANDEINGTAGGLRGNLQLLYVYWHLRFAEFYIKRDRERLACRNLRNTRRATLSWLIGDAVDNIVADIEAIMADLYCYGATYTYDPDLIILIKDPPDAYFGDTLTIDEDTEFSPEFESREGINVNFSIVHTGNGSVPENWGLEFYEDGATLTSTHHLSPSPSTEPFVTDTFGPFNLSDENWKFIVRYLHPDGGAILEVDSVSLTVTR